MVTFWRSLLMMMCNDIWKKVVSVILNQNQVKGSTCILYIKTFGDEKWSNPLIPFWTVFLGMRNEATPNSVLNCFGDENWSNPWIRPNRHPSRRCCCADSWRWCCADSNVLEEFLDLGISIFWAGGVKQPLNPSRHPSMDEASSEAGRTVATETT
jgi:hypothetical protein